MALGLKIFWSQSWIVRQKGMTIHSYPGSLIDDSLKLLFYYDLEVHIGSYNLTLQPLTSSSKGKVDKRDKRKLLDQSGRDDT
jgi:hypothetical protein